MVQNLDWRPSASEVVEAEKLLRQPQASKLMTRLRIVEALKKTPQAKLRVIAVAASTRTAVVTKLLERWKTRGRESLLEFGRPKDLTQAQQNILKEALSSGSLTSLDQVNSFVHQSCGLKFDLRSLRAYCRRFGFNLPVKIRPSVRLHSSWNDASIALVAGKDVKLTRRLTAILRACREPTISLRQAVGNRAPESTLRADLKALKLDMTLDEFVQRRLRIRLLDRLNLKGAFHDWAAEHNRIIGKPPTGRDAFKFFEANKVKMETKSVNYYLTQWKRIAGIKRRYRLREKIRPSDGVAVRDI